MIEIIIIMMETNLDIWKARNLTLSEVLWKIKNFI